jgi:hypothetical protein
MWQAVLDGEVSRSGAHHWAARWVEGDSPDVDDPMVWSALQRLHGFDLVWTDGTRSRVRHGGSGDHVHPLRDIRQQFVAWQSACAAHDAPPGPLTERDDRHSP